MRRFTWRHGARRHRRLEIGLLAVLLLPGCAIARGPVELASKLDALVPHGDRDHFVYRWQRLVDGIAVASGLQVEHIATIGRSGDFEVTLSEDGIASGRVRIHADDKRMVVLSEDDLSRGIRITYQPPLPYLDVPLFAGQRQSVVNGNVSALDESGQPLGVLKVTQNQEFAAGGSIQSSLGSFTNAVSVRTTRIVEGGGDTLNISSQVVLVPGLGEWRSESSSSPGPLLRRELACAIINGKSVGDCQKLKLQARE